VRPMVRVDPLRCQTCERCQARTVCKTRALWQLEPAELPVVEMSRCRGCLVCISACPHGAVQSEPLNAGDGGTGQASQAR
jgi:MinD superfamily P-loop ATPase